MRLAIVVTTAALIGMSASALAKLPPPTEDAKAKAAEAAAKTAWSDKVALYQLCLSMDRTVAAYWKSAKAAGKPVSPPVATPACANPGPYVSPLAMAAKPLEAAGAHSPPEKAVSPPSTKATAAEIAEGGKK